MECHAYKNDVCRHWHIYHKFLWVEGVIMSFCESEVWIYASWIFFVFALTSTLSQTLSRSMSYAIYDRIEKPPLSPPGWIFGVVWPLLYTLLGVSAALVHLTNNWSGLVWPLLLFMVHILLNALWTPIFFGIPSFLWGAVWIQLVDATAILLLVVFLNYSLLAALLLVPYVVWLAFATYLAWGVWHLNRQRVLIEAHGERRYVSPLKFSPTDIRRL